MNSIDLKRELVGRLCDGARAFLDRALPEIGESPIYAFAFFRASGCTSVGGVLATSAGLQKRNQDIGSGAER